MLAATRTTDDETGCPSLREKGEIKREVMQDNEEPADEPVNTEETKEKIDLANNFRINIPVGSQ